MYLLGVIFQFTKTFRTCVYMKFFFNEELSLEICWRNLSTYGISKSWICFSKCHCSVLGNRSFAVLPHSTHINSVLRTGRESSTQPHILWLAWLVCDCSDGFRRWSGILDASFGQNNSYLRLWWRYYFFTYIVPNIDLYALFGHVLVFISF